MTTTTMQERKPIALQTTPSIMREDDLMAHVEDTQLYWVARGNRAVKITWNEMSAQEQTEQIKAKERADFVAMFDPDYCYNY